MIFSLIFSGILTILNYVLTLLPVVNTDVTDLFSSIMNYIVPKFQTLAYYYLPLDTIFDYVKIYISVWIASFGVRLLMRVIPIITGGTVKTDKI